MVGGVRPGEAFGAGVEVDTILTEPMAMPGTPLIGEIHLSSVLLFDLGVYLLVIGATVLMLVALAHQSMRSPRRQLSPLEAEGP